MQENAVVLSSYDKVLARIQAAAARSNRNFKDIKILAVTKYAKEQDVLTLLAHRDIKAVAESRVQESLKKWAKAEFAAFKVEKFFIGQLQSNKTAKVLENFDVICSLDNLHTARRLNRQAESLAKSPRCLIQVKLTDKAAQGGINMLEAAPFIKAAAKEAPNLKLSGIMAIAPVADNTEALRPLFKEVKKLFDDNFESSSYLSLGMSGDFEVAVEEGSNLPRIGSAIFDSV